MYELGRTEGGDAGGGKLAAEGAAPRGATGGAAGGAAGGGGGRGAPSPGGWVGSEDEGEGEGEDDLDAMLKWSDSLDFDSYHQGWLGLATSARPEWSGEAVAY